MVSLVFEIPGPPQPKERARPGRSGRFYTPDRTRLYQAHARSRASVARMAHPAPWPLDGTYRVEFAMYFGDRRRRDVDNVIKGVLDAANGVLWKDDSQVGELVVRRGLDRDRPRVEVRVETLAQPCVEVEVTVT